MKTTLVALCFLFTSACANALVPESVSNSISFNELETDLDGYLRNTSSDSYFVIDDLDLSREQSCGLSFRMSFRKPLDKPTIFDIYWRTAKLGFSEANKAFFIVNNVDSTLPTDYIVPLCKLHGFSGNVNKSALQENISSIRLDYPSDKFISVKFDNLELIDSKAVSLISKSSSDEIKFLEPYERVSASAFTSLDVVIPKLFFSFEHGIKRLGSDVGFLVFWLLLLGLLMFLLIRSLMREYSSSKQDS